MALRDARGSSTPQREIVTKKRIVEGGLFPRASKARNLSQPKSGSCLEKRRILLASQNQKIIIFLSIIRIE